MTFPEKYDPKVAEKKWQEFWKKQGVFKFPDATSKEVFAIDTPPPTVSGKMHLGHAFSFSQQDFIARYKRMRGFEVFYPFGTDDNGLATEKLVQKQKKIVAAKMEREAFIKECLAFLEEERPKFVQDWINLGMSCDFTLMYSTIDDHSRAISQKTFLDLAKKGLVYRKQAPVIWDTVFQSAIAQAELENMERTSYFNDIVFKGEDGKDIVIGTTRPELLGACVALFAHPEDKRYQHLFGKQATSPLYNEKVPILPDEKADPEKGTGMVMCCTFGDQTDIEWFKKHNLPLKMVVGRNGRMLEKSGKYVDMLVADARKAIIADLKEAGLLVKQEKIKQIVNVGERSGQPVEIINSKQWYVKYLDRKEALLRAGDALEWYPQHMKHRLDNWIKGLNWDWSISRQRHFGVPIPVWYDNEGKVYYADASQLPVDPTKDRPLGVSDDVELIGETDVFDTWFTSGSSPFLGADLLKGKPVYDKLFPMSLRPQAHDIINFWLFYTLAKSQLLYEKNPWKAATISGFVLDPKGNKMSKSKGNVIAPQEVIEKFCADAIRFWAATSKLGEDLPYQEKDVKTGQKFVTKLWNATKFVVSHLEEFSPQKPEQLEAFDQWLLAKLDETIATTTAAFDKYEYAKAKSTVEQFFWQIFCDNYLEIVKDRLYNPDTRGVAARKSAQYTLYTALLAIIKMMAPIVPHVTEEIYQAFFKQHEEVESVHVAAWPVASKSTTVPAGDVALEVIAYVRKWKSEQKLSLKAPVAQIVLIGDVDMASLEDDLKAVTHTQEIVFSGDATDELASGMKILVKQ